jgi:hypothetical protein
MPHFQPAQKPKTMDNSGNPLNSTYSKQKTLMIGRHTIYELRQIGNMFELIILYPPDMCGESKPIKKRHAPTDGKFYPASKKHPYLTLVNEPLPFPLTPIENYSHFDKECAKLNAQHFWRSSSHPYLYHA